MTANKNDNELHFDFAIGNPPYHYETGRRKIPIYQYFMESFGNADISGHACFVTPDGFVKGGQQLEKVRRSFLESNKHLKYVEFHKEPIFAGFAVDAAITYFDNENEYDEIAKKIYQEDGSVVEGTLDWSKRDVIVDDSKEEVRAIYEKGIAYYKDNNPEGITMDSVVPPLGSFRLEYQMLPN